MRTFAWKSWAPPTEDDDLWTWQAGRCAACNRRAGDALVLDHCHFTGLCRGYLCRSCNTSEGWSSDEAWEPWRTGDNTAAAIGEFDVYVGLYGDTALSPSAVLSHYSPSERNAWWREVLSDLRNGGEWPQEAPWTDAARARAGYWEALDRAAVDCLPPLTKPGGAA